MQKGEINILVGNTILWKEFIKNHKKGKRYDGCCNCCDCSEIRSDYRKLQKCLQCHMASLSMYECLLSREEKEDLDLPDWCPMNIKKYEQ